MVKVREAIIVEGKYDKLKLSSIVDGLIIETNGFGIFKDREQLGFIQKIAEARGIIILTDSDAAGFVIRGYLSGAVRPENVRQAYIPDIFGKEKRKTKFSKEGKLGVEGVPAHVIIDALRRAEATFCSENEKNVRRITKNDLYFAGLAGGEGSASRRRAFLSALSLPEHLSSNALAKVLNGMMGYDEFISITKT